MLRHGSAGAVWLPQGLGSSGGVGVSLGYCRDWVAHGRHALSIYLLTVSGTHGNLSL